MSSSSNNAIRDPRTQNGEVVVRDDTVNCLAVVRGVTQQYC
jgi:hypothetical protein